MHLERVEIVGFRGINRLSLMLEQNNVLIGENARGKSSLLDALTLPCRRSLTFIILFGKIFGFRPAIFRGASIICISF